MAQTKIGWRPYVSGTDADAQAFITAAAITDSTQQSAINTLVTQLKTYGIWTKMKALYPMVGGSATSHKFNLKDPRDLDAAYRLVFNGGWVHTSTGALPNGTTAFADTKLKPFGVFNNTTYAHMSYYSRTSSGFNNSEYGMGANDGVNNLAFVFRRANNLQAFVADFSNATYRMALNSTSTDGSGFFVGTQQGANIKLLKQNSLHVSNTTTGTGGIPPNYNVFIGALNSLNVSESFTNKESAFASIGDGLTDAEAANFYTAVQTYQSTLGRQVISDADAKAFIIAANITDSTQQYAIDTLVTDLKANNLWSSLLTIYPFVGGTATSHKFNLKDPRDLAGAFRLDFGGGWTHNSTGALANGVNAYASTNWSFNYQMNGSYTNGSVHTSAYIENNPTPIANSLFGAAFWGGADTREAYTSLKNPSTGLFNGVLGSSVTFQNTDMKGYYVTSRTSNASLKVFKNNQTMGTNTISNTNTNAPQYSYHIGALYYNGNIGFYNNYQYSFITLGAGLTDVDSANLYNVVQKYQTTLGRQV